MCCVSVCLLAEQCFGMMPLPALHVEENFSFVSLMFLCEIDQIGLMLPVICFEVWTQFMSNELRLGHSDT